MNIQEEYQQETGLYHYDSGSMDFKWSDNYVEWLEKRVKVLTLTDVSEQRELLENYQHFIDWNEEHDRKASKSERIESFIAYNCG
jgi:hypothetical protein